MTLRGAWCFDHAYYNDDTPALNPTPWTVFGGIPAKAASLDTALWWASAQYSPLGFGTSGATNPFDAISTAGKCWFYHPIKVTSITGGADTTEIFWSEGDPNGTLPNGTIVVSVIPAVDELTYGLSIRGEGGGANNEATTARAKNTVYWLCYEVDFAAKTVALFVDGGATAVFTATFTYTPVVGLPRLGNDHITGKGTGIVYIASEFIVNDSSGTENNTKLIYTAAASSTHCVSAYGISDVAGGDFTASGLNCGSDLFRAICDPAFQYTQANDYINVTPGAAAKSQRFLCDQCSGATIRGVYICAASEAKAAPDYTVDKLLLKESAGAEQVITGVKNWSSTSRPVRYSYRATPPNSASWSQAVFNDLTAGVQTDAGSTDERRVQGFHLGVVGENLARVAQKVCPVAGAFVPRVVIC